MNPVFSLSHSLISSKPPNNYLWRLTLSTYNIQALTPRHYIILDLCLQGFKVSEISTQLQMSRAQVSTVVNSPSFQHQFAIKRKELEQIQNDSHIGTIDLVSQELKDNAHAAAERLTYGLSSENETIALKSAVEILDRSGYPKEQKLSGGVVATQIIISSKEMAVLNETISMDKLRDLEPDYVETKKEMEMPAEIISSD